MKTKKYFVVFKEGSKVNQIFCAVLINLPVFAYGASIGWMSPMTLLLQSEDSPTKEPLSNFSISWMASIGYLICIPANFLMAFMSDKFGRKLSLLSISAALSVSWILMLCSLNVYVMILARAIIGIIMGGSFVTCPVYTKEISDDSIRGALGCLEAKRVLAWLKCRDEEHPEIQSELERIKKEQLKDEGSAKFMLKTIVSDKILLRAFCIAMVVTVGREICGAITVLNYAGEIFAYASEADNLVLSPNQQAMVLGSVQVMGAMLASGIVEKAGRKSLLLVTSVLSGLSMCALASWFLSRDFGAFLPTWLPIVTLCVCIFCDSLGLQPISVVLVGEIFSYKYRVTMLAITMSSASFLAFLQLLFFKTISDSIGVYVAFFFFGAVCLLAALYVMVAVPETKNRRLEEIYSDLRTKKEKEKDKEIENAKEDENVRL